MKCSLIFNDLGIDSTDFANLLGWNTFTPGPRILTSVRQTEFSGCWKGLTAFGKLPPESLMFAFLSKLLYPVFPVSIDDDSIVPFCQKSRNQSWLLSLFPYHIQSIRKPWKYIQVLSASPYFHCYCSHLNHQCVLPYSYIHSWLISLLPLCPPQSQQRSQSDPSKMHIRLLGYPETWSGSHFTLSIK